MKLLLLTSSMLLLAATEKSCKNKKVENPAVANCYKGRLEIKAGCMNYTIGVTEGTVDTSLVQASWTDESTGKSYKNVFALESKCDFPATINQGDEFYFMIDSTVNSNCAVCMMYYPVPSKKLPIKIITEPCAK